MSRSAAATRPSETHQGVEIVSLLGTRTIPGELGSGASSGHPIVRRWGGPSSGSAPANRRVEYGRPSTPGGQKVHGAASALDEKRQSENHTPKR